MRRYQRQTLLMLHRSMIYHSKKTTMSTFQLNFNSAKKIVTISLVKDDAIFDLANLFKKLLDDAGIENTITETLIEEPTPVETEETA